MEKYIHKLEIMNEKDLENKDISQILRTSIKKLKKRWSPLFPLGFLGDISRPIGLFPNMKGLSETAIKTGILGFDWPGWPCPKKDLNVYTTEWCGDCDVLKRYFSKKKINWKSLDIDSNESHLKEVLLLSLGRRVIPTLDYGDFVLINPPMHIIHRVYEGSTRRK
tara:strand:- start:850 stop:1344 length:495 start_codon:yes stop_codon:yes gene_type:complete